MKRIIADIDPGLHKKLKLRAADEGRSIKDIVLELIRKYLGVKND